MVKYFLKTEDKHSLAKINDYIWLFLNILFLLNYWRKEMK